MLIEFSIGNFKSYGETQRFSMVASAASRRLPDFSFESGSRLAPAVLRTAVIFGANGSGKSSLVEAMLFFVKMVEESAKNTQEGESIRTQPFAFDPRFERKPSFFEMIFAVNGNAYQYGFEADSKRIHAEWLFQTPQGTGQKTLRIFDRTYDRGEKEYVWYINPSIKGAKKVWQNATRDNALFFSTAIQLNAEAFAEPFSFFSDKIQTFGAHTQVHPDFTEDLCETEKKDEILRFMQASDINIVDVRVDEMPFDETLLPAGLPPSQRRRIVEQLKGQTYKRVFMGHQLPNGEIVYLDLRQESEGTRVLFALSGPWLDSLETGNVLILDELSNNLHPLALKFLVSAFNSKHLNESDAQLIFTSHDTSIMQAVHRDQINLVERDRNLMSRIVPLSDFSPRTDEIFEKSYLSGRFGGIPLIQEFERN